MLDMAFCKIIHSWHTWTIVHYVPGTVLGSWEPAHKARSSRSSEGNTRISAPPHWGVHGPEQRECAQDVRGPEERVSGSKREIRTDFIFKVRFEKDHVDT